MSFRVCLFVLAVLPSIINAQGEDTRIVGGTVSANIIPYQIALYLNGNFICGGSLITPNCVLTAAHCVKGKKAANMKVRAGISQLSKHGGAKRKVIQYYLPGNFDMSTMNYDVAVLKLNYSITAVNTATIPLNKVQMKVGDKLKVSGWGVTHQSASTVSDKLRYVFVPAVARATCEAEYPGQITKAMFCAGAVGGGKDSCSGDSGGPVVKDNRLYGIVSWGNGCARTNFVGVYTSIRKVAPWIENVIAKHCN